MAMQKAVLRASLGRVLELFEPMERAAAAHLASVDALIAQIERERRQVLIEQGVFRPAPWGAACRHLREGRGLSRGEMARLAGITETTYGRIERGFDTQTRKLQAVADALGVPLTDVLGQR